MPGKCPGMNPANWKIEDIAEIACIHCGKPIEFWKDDVRRTCPCCGETVFNPNIGKLCLVWCKNAAECIGNQDIIEWKVKFMK
jgi:hypothetical protein